MNMNYESEKDMEQEDTPNKQNDSLTAFQKWVKEERQRLANLKITLHPGPPRREKPLEIKNGQIVE